MGILDGLRPEKVFHYFELLSSVPHGSENTGKISDICVDFANRKGLRFHRDELNNVIIYKDATEGYENAETVILQGHLDMVCTKTADCKKDMAAEGIDLVVDGDWIKADGTSLGGDNGIAVAMILAILDDDSLSHPALEAVFTVDEETGMFGAIGLDTSLLKGKRLINLDSEDEGVFTAGCAGGRRLNCTLPVKREPLCGHTCVTVTVSGLLSGHSGVDIAKGRGSSNRLMGRMLHAISESIDICLVSLEGGELDNVIPKLTTATVAVPDGEVDGFVALVKDYDAIYKNEFAASDPAVRVEAAVGSAADLAVTREDTVKSLAALVMLPYHVQDMSMDIEGLVQTSLNMGVLRLLENSLEFSFSVRSCITSCKEDLIRRVCTTVKYMGGAVSQHGDYPAWQFAKESPLRDLVLNCYRDLFGKDGVVSATHGGLECGLFMDRIGGLDCISFGPDLCDVHSPAERLSISSTERLTELVIEILKRSR